MAWKGRYSSSCDEAMQRYLMLSSQQEVLRRRLSLDTAATVSMPASATQSLSSSPTSSRTSFSYSPSESIPMQSNSRHRHSMSNVEDVHKLSDISQEMKATLTELLNTDSARSDIKYRSWIQGQLMDAEHQIRQTRRRRSSGSVGDRQFASSIAEHLELGLHACKTWA